MKSTAAEPAIVKSIPVECAPMEPATVEAAKSATSVETAAPTPAVWPGIGEVWRARAQQNSCNR